MEIKKLRNNRKKHTTTGMRAVKNLSSLLASNVFIFILSFLTVAFLARKLTASGFGRLAFAQAIFYYFALIGNFGLYIFGIREIARNRNDEIAIRKIVNNIITLQTLLSIIAAILLTLFAFLLPRPIEDKILISLFGCCIILTGLHLDWAYKGLERMGVIAIDNSIRASLYALLIFLFIREENDILKVPIFMIISLAIAITIPLLLYIRKYGLPKPSVNVAYWGYALRIGIPLFISIMLTKIYYNLDTIMLGFMKTDEIVGYYNAAYKIVLALLVFGSLFIETIFPLISRFYKDSKEKLKILLNISEKTYISIAIPIGVGGTILAGQLVMFIFGEGYSEATTALRILIWTVVIVYISTTYGYTLMGCNMERKYLISVSFAAIINVILNFILIPPFGIIGAAIATVVAEITALICVAVFSRKICHIYIGRYLIRPIIAASIMAVALIWMPFHVVINIFLGSIIYIMVFMILGGIKSQDIYLFKKYVLGKS